MIDLSRRGYSRGTTINFGDIPPIVYIFGILTIIALLGYILIGMGYISINLGIILIIIGIIILVGLLATKSNNSEYYKLACFALGIGLFLFILGSSILYFFHHVSVGQIWEHYSNTYFNATGTYVNNYLTK